MSKKSTLKQPTKSSYKTLKNVLGLDPDIENKSVQETDSILRSKRWLGFEQDWNSLPDSTRYKIKNEYPKEEWDVFGDDARNYAYNEAKSRYFDKINHAVVSYNMAAQTNPFISKALGVGHELENAYEGLQMQMPTFSTKRGKGVPFVEKSKNKSNIAVTAGDSGTDIRNDFLGADYYKQGVSKEAFIDSLFEKGVFEEKRPSGTFNVFDRTYEDMLFDYFGEHKKHPIEGLEKYGEGGEVMGPENPVVKGTEAYKEARKDNRVTGYNPNTDTYLAPTMDEVTVSAPDLSVAKAAREGANKFGKDYVVPALEMAAGFNPATATGLSAYNAYQNFKEGNYWWGALNTAFTLGGVGWMKSAAKPANLISEASFAERFPTLAEKGVHKYGTGHIPSMSGNLGVVGESSNVATRAANTVGEVPITEYQVENKIPFNKPPELPQEGGLHLRSTARGTKESLANMANKHGYVNVNALRQKLNSPMYANKLKGDKHFIEKVLQEDFPTDAKAIKFEDLRNAVNKRLSEFTHTDADVVRQTERLKFSHLRDKGTFKSYGWEELEFSPEEFEVNPHTMLYRNAEELGTGKVKHFTNETLGHLRGAVLKESPDTYTAIEPFQSDALQSSKAFPFESGGLSKADKSTVTKNLEKIAKYKEEIEDPSKMKLVKEGTAPEQIDRYKAARLRKIKRLEREVNKIKGYGIGDEQKSFMRKFQTERLFQETLLEAQSQGAKKVRVPTPETLIKSQKYPTIEGAEGKVLLEDLEKHGPIVKRYQNSIKQIEKNLGFKPRKVTDSKGNTWFEYDIPENFNKQDRIAFGSSTSKVPELERQFSELSEHFKGIKSELRDYEKEDWLNRLSDLREKIQETKKIESSLHPDFGNMKEMEDFAFRTLSEYASESRNAKNLDKARLLDMNEGWRTPFEERSSNMLENVNKVGDMPLASPGEGPKINIEFTNSIPDYRDGEIVEKLITNNKGNSEISYTINLRPGLSKKRLTEVVKHELKHYKGDFSKFHETNIGKEINKVLVKGRDEVIRNFKKLFPKFANDERHLKELNNQMDHFYGTDKQSLGELGPIEFDTTLGTDFKEELVNMGLLDNVHEDVTREVLNSYFKNVKENGGGNFFYRMAFIKSDPTSRTNFIKTLNKLMYTTTGAVAGKELLNKK